MRKPRPLILHIDKTGEIALHLRFGGADPKYPTHLTVTPVAQFLSRRDMQRLHAWLGNALKALS